MTCGDPTAHWQSVYRRKRQTEVSWFAPHLTVSLEMMLRAGLTPESRVIDVGGGASTLVDDLLDRGLRHLTVVDLSEAALEVSQQRLGVRATGVEWIAADACKLDHPPESYDIWHDRAALHFLVDPVDSAGYVARATAAVKRGGFAVIGCFAADGPEKCSGLPVVRRDPRAVADLFGPAFELMESRHEQHTTPSGLTQSFAYALLRKTGR